MMRFGLWHTYLTLTARVAARIGYRARAIEMYEEIAKQWPADSSALVAIGHLVGQTGRLAEARSWFEKAIAVAPDSSGAAVAHFNIGYLYDRAGDMEAAVMAFQKAVALNPKIDRAWYGLGLVLVKLHREKEAKHAFQQVVEIDTMNKHGWYQLGMTHLALGEETELRGLMDHTRHFDPKIAMKLEADSKLLRKQLAEEAASKAQPENPAGAAPAGA
jgi:tetratricopeptide (TPR) repeat protein